MTEPIQPVQRHHPFTTALSSLAREVSTFEALTSGLVWDKAKCQEARRVATRLSDLVALRERAELDKAIRRADQATTRIIRRRRN